MSTAQTVTLAQLLKQKPQNTAPVVVTLPQVNSEIQVGDAVKYFSGSASGFPVPTSTPVLTVGGTVQSNGYTAQSGDLGSVAVVSQPFSNYIATVPASSNAPVVIVQQSAYNNHLIGTNTTQQVDYNPAYYLNNAAQCGLHPTDLSGGYISPSNIASDGWPTVSFRIVISAALGSLDGQLAAGTYNNCSYRLRTANPSWVPGTVPTVSSYQDCTISGLTLQSDNITVKFTMVVASAKTPVLQFSGGVSYPYIPRDGSTSSLGPSLDPEFHPDVISFMKQFASFRMMDFNNTIPAPVNATSLQVGYPCIIYTNGTQDFTALGAASNAPGTVFISTGIGTGTGTVLIPEVTWANRLPDYGVTGPGYPFSLERQIRFMNAVAAASGSKITTIWFNIGAFVDTGYAANAAALITSTYVGGVPLTVEIGNEPWNTGSTIFPTYSCMAQAECQTVATYGVAASNIINGTGGSVTGDGTTTIVTLATGKTMPSFVTNGATFYVRNSNTTSWCTDGSNNQYSLSNLATVLSVNATTFTYASKGNGTMTLGDPFRCYFNPTSTLLSDGLSTDIFQLIYKWYVRQTYRVWQQFTSAGRLDNFVLNLQPYQHYGSGIAQGLPIHYQYANYIGGVPTNTSPIPWLYGASIANYVKATSRYASANTASPNQILGVPWAAYAQPGDSINIGGIGPAGAALATTVGVGSSGTTLVITGTVSTNVTASLTNPPTITYTDGDSSAICNCMLYGCLPIMELQTRAHAYACILYGLRMMCYETSIDIQSIPNQQVSVTSNALVGTVITKLLDVWFNGGGKEAYLFTAQPGNITNVAQGSWNYLTSWTDTTSPRIAALLAYTAQRVYNNLFSPTPGAAPAFYAYRLTGVGNSNADTSVAYGVDSNGASFNTNTTNAMVYFTTNTGARNVDWTGVFNRSARYTAILSGSDSVAGTVATVWLDGVQYGSATLPANGSGSANGTAPGNATVFNLIGGTGMDLPSGMHTVSVRFSSTPPNVGTLPGVYSLIFTAA